MALRAWCLFLPLVLTVSAAAACSKTVTKEVDDPSATDDDDDDTASLKDLQFRPAEMYSGYDGENSFNTPFAVYNADDDIEVTASPANAVTITAKTLVEPDGDEGKYYFAETKADGDVTLTVKSKGRTATGKLHITKYDASRFAAGKTRYEAGTPPCTACHGATGIDHSPTALSSVTDEKVGLIMSTGLATGGVPIQIDKTNYPNGHKWTTGPGPEQDGLITYCRALLPQGFK